jgi:hypothetical protein
MPLPGLNILVTGHALAGKRAAQIPPQRLMIHYRSSVTFFAPKYKRKLNEKHPTRRKVLQLSKYTANGDGACVLSAFQPRRKILPMVWNTRSKS